MILFFFLLGVFFYVMIWYDVVYGLGYFFFFFKWREGLVMMCYDRSDGQIAIAMLDMVHDVLCSLC